MFRVEWYEDAGFSVNDRSVNFPTLEDVKTFLHSNSTYFGTSEIRKYNCVKVIEFKEIPLSLFFGEEA